MTASPAYSRIRPFSTEDIPEVADLHRRVFGVADRTSPELLESYRTYFTEVLLNNPWREDTAGGLVHQEKNGKITGFLAVAPRRMSIHGRPAQARITSLFVVDPNFRGIGVNLLSAALTGPQDLTIADEANANSRIIWEALGGATLHLYSMRWIYPLRPCQFALFVMKKKRLLPPVLSGVSAPLARTLDALAARIPKLPFRPSAPRVFGEDLDCETLLACLSEMGRQQAIRPDYDNRSLGWILQRADQMRMNGRLQKVLVKTESGEIAGWYLYYANPAGLSEVIQLHARAGFARDVLDHLFYHAWEQGVTVLSGRMEPNFMQAFSDKHCIFHCGPQWVLVHSRRPELLQAFDQGNAGFSRLDGEWSLHLK